MCDNVTGLYLGGNISFCFLSNICGGKGIGSNKCSNWIEAQSLIIGFRVFFNVETRLYILIIPHSRYPKKLPPSFVVKITFLIKGKVWVWGWFGLQDAELAWQTWMLKRWLFPTKWGSNLCFFLLLMTLKSAIDTEPRACSCHLSTEGLWNRVT